jgi:hypothetical protein
MESNCNPMELSSMAGFEEGSELNGFEGANVKDMRLEAEAVVNDVLFAINNMFVSKSLLCADDVAYINVETKERNRYCLELTEAGLRVVGYAFDHSLPQNHPLPVGYAQPCLPRSIWKCISSETGSFEKGWAVLTELFLLKGDAAGL